MNVQEAVAKALLVDADALEAAQAAGDVLAANAALMDAYNTDVRPLLAELRAEMGLAPDPIAAYLASDYGEEVFLRTEGGVPRGLGSLIPMERRQATARAEQSAELTRATPTTPGATPSPRAPRPTRPRDARRTLMGGRLRRRPRHACQGAPGGAAARPGHQCARANYQPHASRGVHRRNLRRRKCRV